VELDLFSAASLVGTSFRPKNQAHLSFALPRVIGRILSEEDLTVDAPRFVRADVIFRKFTKSLVWPEWVRLRHPVLTFVSVIVPARRAR